MTPTNQTRLYSEDGIGSGDCYPACLASLLDLPLWAVPAFDEMFSRGRAQFESRLNLWLERFFASHMTRVEGHPHETLLEFYIAVGPAKRGVHHAAVYSRGVLTHDPHPSGRGLIAVDWCEYIEKN